MSPFSINANSPGNSRIDEIVRCRAHAVRKCGLLGAMQDRAYISAYRSLALNLSPARSRVQSYLSHNQAYKVEPERKQASLRHLRISQSSCFLMRLLRAMQEQFATNQARQNKLSATAATG